MRILIVDDDAHAALLLATLLQDIGSHQTRVVHSAASALQSAMEFDPEIIFLDIELPDMSGYEVARLMHQHPRLQHVRLMALTDSGEHPAREQARASGFERYIVKPVMAGALREVLSTARVDEGALAYSADSPFLPQFRRPVS